MTSCGAIRFSAFDTQRTRHAQDQITLEGQSSNCSYISHYLFNIEYESRSAKFCLIKKVRL